MKIAYLLTAYDNPKHLIRILKSTNNSNVDYFIHIDKKSKYKFEIPNWRNIHILKENNNVNWGGFSFIQAVIKLLEYANNNDKYYYFVLLSGTDYPIKNNKKIFNFFSSNNGTEFINLSPMPNNDKPLHRVEYFYLENALNYHISSLWKRIFNRLVRILHIKRRLPKEYLDYIFFGGSNWWALTYNCVNYILNFIKKNPKFVNYYRYTLIPEESFFHTIIGNSKYINNVSNSVTYAYWSKNHIGHPELITKRHLKIFDNESIKTDYGNGQARILFARKFSDNNPEVIEEIDKFLRK